VGNADQRSKKVEGNKIPPYVAALDRAFHQRVNRSLDQAARALEELRRASDETIQCGGYDLLGRNVVDEQQHPRSQRLSRGHRFGEFALCSGHLFHFASVDRFDQGVPRGKVAIQSSGSYTCLFGDIVQAGVRAETGKRLLRHFQNASAVPLRIRARFSLGGF